MSHGYPRTEAGSRLETWFWLLGAPLSVVAGLLVAHSVFLVFAVYHLGFCLLLPPGRNILGRGFTAADHLACLGLTGPGTGRGLLLGLGSGVILAGAIILVFRQLGGIFLADHDIPGILARWGVDQGRVSLLFWFMVLVNGPAEELYWRGFVYTRLSHRKPPREVILLTAACYAGYHGVTVFLLVANLPVAALFMVAIFFAGTGWGLLREKTGSVWPALLGHAGAAAAYMAVARPLLES